MMVELSQEIELDVDYEFYGDQEIEQLKKPDDDSNMRRNL
jgi:hypothetical protein